MKDKARPTTIKHCFADPNCIMTMGYYMGGGLYICWMHALVTPGCITAITKTNAKPEIIQPRRTP